MNHIINLLWWSIGGSVPSNSVKYEDGTPLRYEDNGYVTYE
jgi:hypothetical protein